MSGEEPFLFLMMWRREISGYSITILNSIRVGFIVVLLPTISFLVPQFCMNIEQSIADSIPCLLQMKMHTYVIDRDG